MSLHSMINVRCARLAQRKGVLLQVHVGQQTVSMDHLIYYCDFDYCGSVAQVDNLASFVNCAMLHDSADVKTTGVKTLCRFQKMQALDVTGAVNGDGSVVAGCSCAGPCARSSVKWLHGLNTDRLPTNGPSDDHSPPPALSSDKPQILMIVPALRPWSPVTHCRRNEDAGICAAAPHHERPFATQLAFITDQKVHTKFMNLPIKA